MSKWYDINEQSAGEYRLIFLWYVYKIFKLKGLKFLLYPIVFCISLFCKSARLYSKEYQQIYKMYCNKHKIKYKNFSSFSHIYNYACTLADKMSAICDKNTPIKFKINADKNWRSFKNNLHKGKGMCLISTHLGNVEAFCAYPQKTTKIKVHALMEISQSSIFHKFIENRTTNHSFLLYPSERVDFQTMMTLYENICDGDIVLMAGDRISAENPGNFEQMQMLERKCRIPRGVFKFSQKVNCPTFVIILVYIGNSTYQINLKELDTSKHEKFIIKEYTKFVEKNIIKYPEQWYNFYSFFE